MALGNDTLCTYIYPYPFFEATPPGAALHRGPCSSLPGCKNCWLVFENSFSPAVGSPRWPIKKSHTPTEKSCTERARLYGNTACSSEHSQKFTSHKALSADTSRARYISGCEESERDKGGGGSRGSRAHQRKHKRSRKLMTPASLRAKLLASSHHPNHHLGDAPREGCACERTDPPRGACSPAEQGLEHSQEATEGTAKTDVKLVDGATSKLHTHSRTGRYAFSLSVIKTSRNRRNIELTALKCTRIRAFVQS